MTLLPGPRRTTVSIFVLLLFAVFRTSAATLPPGFSESLIAQGLDPTDMTLLSDGRIFITIKSGKVVIVEDGILRAAPLLNIEDRVDNYNERGLGHIVLDPAFDSNGFYYLFYTVAGQNLNRVSRFTAIGNFSDPTSEQIIIELDNMPGTIHNAGDMIFGLDGKLYISTGDGAQASAAQSLSSLLGKVLRINADGTIPADNPFVTTTTGKYQSIFALGFRNPFSMDIDPGSDAIFVSEVGNSAWEEINHVQAGRNYGWPGIEGMRVGQALPAIGTYKDPEYVYPHGSGVNAGCAIVGAAFYRPQQNQFPAAYHGQFFFADYCNGYIKYLDPANTANVHVFAENIDRPLMLLTAPDGSMYYLARGGLGGGSEGDNTSSSEGTLWRVTYTGSGAPSISISPQNALVSIGETVEFSVTATGAPPVSFQWQVNGTDIDGATQSTYSLTNAQAGDNGNTFRCVVSNTFGAATSGEATLTVTSNTRPEPQFTWALTSGGMLYRGGESLTLEGSAADAEDGNLPATALTWKIDFHHDHHHHPALASLSGVSSYTYEIPKVGETSSNVWYRVYLTATDLSNPSLSKTIYQDIFPDKVDITLLTVPEGLTLLLDGQTITAPHTFTSVVNTTRMLEAPSSLIDNQTAYTFDHWSTGTTRTLVFDTPPEDITFTATYKVVPLGNGSGLMGYYFTNQEQTFNGAPTMVRLDPTIDFDWVGGSPDPRISNDNFTVRWLGEILPPFTDTYTFFLTGDDGIRLWINDELLIDKWVDQPPTEWSGSIALEENLKYPIKVEYYERGGGALVSLSWSTPQLVKHVIPTSQLSTDIITSNESIPQSGLHVYPTIIRESFTVEHTDGMYGEWILIDALGHIVMTGPVSDRFIVSATALKPGVYIFRMGSKIVRIAKY